MPPPKDWILPCVVALVALLLLWLAGPQALEWRYERAAILDGEWWRLLSGHWVHLGWHHLGLNLVGLLLIWLLVGQVYTSMTWLLLILSNTLFIGLCLLWWQTQLQWYVGLSGLLHGILMAGALALWFRGRAEGKWLFWLVLFKLGWEFWQVATPHDENGLGGAVITEAHLYGALGGLMFAMVAQGGHLALRRWRASNGGS